MTIRTIIGLAAAVLLVAGCAGQTSSTAALSSSPPSSTPPLDFRGSVTDAVTDLESDGFACEINSAAPTGSTDRPPLNAIRVANCRKTAPSAQGTFVTVYGLRADGTLAGIDVLTDQGGADPASSGVIAAALGRAFASADVAAVVAAVRTAAAGGGSAIALSDRVRVQAETGPLLFRVEVWGPAVVAFSEALQAPSPGSSGAGSVSP